MALNAYLSGGAANALASLSIGGAKSSVAAPKRIIGPVTTAQYAVAGDIYRLVYVSPTVAAEAMKMFIGTQTLSPASDIEIGWAAAGINTTEPAIADQATAPAGVVFSAEQTPDGGDFNANDYRGVWIRYRHVSTQPLASDGFILSYRSGAPIPPGSGGGDGIGSALGRLTPVGDSLFTGNGSGPIYYAPWQTLGGLLDAGGYSYTWVGTRGPSGHYGWPGDIPISSAGGWEVGDISGDLGNLGALDPDTVVVSIGTNNLASAAAGITGYLNNLVSAMGGLTGKRVFVCAPVKVWLDPGDYATLRAAEVAWCAAGANRFFVDLDAAGLAGPDFSDGTHWTASGANKIATHIYAAILAAT